MEYRGLPIYITEFNTSYTPFHGGFGLVANGCIPKPTFWIFVFYKKLQSGRGQCVYRDENVVVMRKKDGSYQGIGTVAQEKCGSVL